MSQASVWRYDLPVSRDEGGVGVWGGVGGGIRLCLRGNKTAARPIAGLRFHPVLPAFPRLPFLHVRARNSVTTEHNRSALPVNQAHYEFILLSGGQKQSALLAAGSLFRTNIHTN